MKEQPVYTRYISVTPRPGFRWNPMTDLYEETDDSLRKRITKDLRSRR